MLVVGGVAKTAPHFPKSTLAAAQEKFGMGGGPERDLAAADGDADWAAGILVTGIADWAAFGHDPGFLVTRSVIVGRIQ